MKGMLAHWGEPVAGREQQIPMRGMVDDHDAAAADAERRPFDVLSIRSMIGHHQGAIDMAQMEVAHGRNPDAVKMAGFIVTAQQREISQLNHLLTVSE